MTTIQYKIAPTPQENRIRKYIDAGLEIYSLRLKANRSGNKRQAILLTRALNDIDAALRCSNKDPQAAQRFTAYAFANVERACPTLPSPPPAQYVNVARAA